MSANINPKQTQTVNSKVFCGALSMMNAISTNVLTRVKNVKMDGFILG